MQQYSGRYTFQGYNWKTNTVSAYHRHNILKATAAKVTATFFRVLLGGLFCWYTQNVNYFPFSCWNLQHPMKIYRQKIKNILCHIIPITPISHAYNSKVCLQLSRLGTLLAEIGL